MKRIKLSDRQLQAYSVGEEVMNMMTHILGGALGLTAEVLCLIRCICRGTGLEILGCGIYGSALVILYTISSVYHGLRPGMA